MTNPDYWRRVLDSHEFRWLVFLPLSMLSLTLVVMVGQQLSPRVLGIESGFARELVSFGTVSFLSPFALMLVGAWIAPSHRVLVAVGMASLCVMLHVSIWPTGIENPVTQSTFFQSAFLYTLGFLATSVGIFLAWCSGIGIFFQTRKAERSGL